MAEEKDLVAKFLQASVAAREAERLAARRRQRWTIGLLLTGLTLITVLAIVATTLGTQAGRRADDLAVALESAEHLRAIAESRALAAYSEIVMDGDPQLAVLLGLEAVYRTHRNVPGTMTAKACSAPHRATSRSRWQATLYSGHTGSIKHAAWNSDDTRIVTASDDGSARIYIADADALIGFACTRTDRNLTQEEWRRYVGADVPYRKTCPNLPIS